jgi:tripartite-type tricarboxylate transporter receptor subunit TctC
MTARCGLFLTLLLAAAPGFAQTYPHKAIRIMTGGAGGGSDFTARLIAQGISGPLKQPVIVDNRPSGLIATEIAAAANPDGYTLLFYGSNLWITPLMEKTSYDAVRDFAPITLTNREPYILAVHPSVPATTTKELIELCKSKPGVLNYASASVGSSTWLAAELFKSMAGVDITSIPYKSAAPARTDLIAGRVQIMFATPAGIMPLIGPGKVRALAITSQQPSELIPDVPTIAATGLPGFEAAQISGALAPAKTPFAIVARLNQEIVAFLAKPETRKRFLDAGLGVVTGSPDQFRAVMKAEINRYGKLIRSAGIGKP